MLLIQSELKDIVNIATVAPTKLSHQALTHIQSFSFHLDLTAVCMFFKHSVIHDV